MSQHRDGEGVGLSVVLGVLRRRLWIILLAIALSAGVAFAISHSQQKKYAATVLFNLRDTNYTTIIGGPNFPPALEEPARRLETAIRLISLGVVAQRTSNRLHHRLTPVQIEDAVSTNAIGTSDLFTLTVTEPDPRLATRVANIYAREFVAFRQNTLMREIDRALAGVRAQIRRLPKQHGTPTPEQQALLEGQGGNVRSQLRQRENSLQVIQSLGPTASADIIVAKRAIMPTSPVSPKPKRDALIGALGGLLLGLAVALVLEQLDRRLNDPEQLEEVFGSPILGTVPKSKALVAGGPRRGPVNELPPLEAEAFQLVRANMRYFHAAKDLRSVLVTSAEPQDGKSTVALHLAMAAASTGSKVLLMEADVRQPTLAKRLGLPGDVGLATIFEAGHQMSLLDVCHRIPVAQHQNGSLHTLTMDVMLAGPVPAHLPQLLQTDRMRELIREAERMYDLVVIDTPPSIMVSDATPLMGQVSGVIVVSRLHSTTRSAARKLHERLHHLEAPVLGVVVNGATHRDDPYYY